MRASEKFLILYIYFNTLFYMFFIYLDYFKKYPEFKKIF